MDIRGLRAHWGGFWFRYLRAVVNARRVIERHGRQSCSCLKSFRRPVPMNSTKVQSPLCVNELYVHWNPASHIMTVYWRTVGNAGHVCLLGFWTKTVHTFPLPSVRPGYEAISYTAARREEGPSPCGSAAGYKTTRSAGRKSMWRGLLDMLPWRVGGQIGPTIRLRKMMMWPDKNFRRTFCTPTIVYKPVAPLSFKNPWSATGICNQAHDLPLEHSSATSSPPIDVKKEGGIYNTSRNLSLHLPMWWSQLIDSTPRPLPPQNI